MSKRSLQIQQLNDKISGFASLNQAQVPSIGWIKAIRTTIGMSMQQFGNKLSISKQGIPDIEKREKNGSVTIKSLPEIGKALNMKLDRQSDA